MEITKIQMLISLLPLAYVVGMAIPVLVIDLRERRVPNKVVMPLLLLTLLCWLTLAVWQGKWAELGLSVLLGMAVLVIGSFANIKLDLIGMGDVKLLVTLTVIVTWFSVLAGLLLLPIVLLISTVAILFMIMLYAIGLIDLGDKGSIPIYPWVMVSFGLVMYYLLK